MVRKIFIIALGVLLVLPMTISGCKGKVEKPAEEPKMEVPESVSATGEIVTNIEPANTVAAEAIPPTATVGQATAKVTPLVQSVIDKTKDIQRALKNAGFDVGTVDGKIGPKTKKAIEDFQKSKGLKADGKVGPKTWMELEKYLIRQ
ncbi:MAG: peptidoglycan-binding domain-containing protein [Candidatus Omnitrophica bacterium]|nr:peptidoglycan-binding domain-containing protein [Candidatus Omnitrophota bacterium]